MVWLKNYEIPSNQAFLSAIPDVSGQNYLKLAIILKENGDLIGFCNTGIKEELCEPNREIAYAISKHYRNHGYTTKAVKGLINYLFKNTDIEYLNAVVLPCNVSSNKVVQKCGFRLIGNIDHYILQKEENTIDRLR